MSGEEPVSAHVYKIRYSPSGFFDKPVYRYVCRCGCVVGGFSSREEAVEAAEGHIAESATDGGRP